MIGNFENLLLHDLLLCLRSLLLLFFILLLTPDSQFLIINCIRHFNELSTLYACKGARCISARLMINRDIQTTKKKWIIT